MKQKLLRGSHAMGLAVRIIVSVLIIALIIWKYDEFKNIDIRALVEASSGVVAAVASILGIYLLKSLVFVVPASLIYIAVGLAFPTHWAILINAAGILIEISATYLFGIIMGGPYVVNKLKKVKYGDKILELQGKNKLSAIFIIRVLPVFPIDIVSLLLGAAAQLGVFVAFIGAIALNLLNEVFGVTIGFTASQAASIGIIGGADGPTAIFLTTQLAPELLGAIAVAAYSYMALIPLIQPPFMKLLTTPEMRKVKMEQTRNVSKTEKIIFPIVVTVFVALLLPDTAPLIGCLMLGNLFKETGVTDRLSDTVQNALMNIVTILLSTAVGATMVGSTFLTAQTLKIVVLGVCAFILSTCGGLLGGLVMCKLTGGKVNPLIGSAGVSAVPMAARVSNMVGQKNNPSNFLLMHAMGPNVAGVIGSAIAAGFLLSVFG